AYYETVLLLPKQRNVELILLHQLDRASWPEKEHADLSHSYMRMEYEPHSQDLYILCGVLLTWWDETGKLRKEGVLKRRSGAGLCSYVQSRVQKSRYPKHGRISYCAKEPSIIYLPIF